jgi:hypothetical protein
MPEQFDAHNAMAAFSETDLGGQDAVADYGCKTPLSRMVPLSRAPKRPRGWGIVVRSRQVPPDTSLQALGSEHRGSRPGW